MWKRSRRSGESVGDASGTGLRGFGSPETAGVRADQDGQAEGALEEMPLGGENAGVLLFFAEAVSPDEEEVGLEFDAESADASIVVGVQCSGES